MVQAKQEIMSREQILNKIKANKPGPRPLPDIPDFAPLHEDPVEGFVQNLQGGASTVVEVKNLEAIPAYWREHFPDASLIAAPIKPEWDTVGRAQVEKPADLKGVDLAILRAHLGVAENGAIWLREQDMGFRVLPFINQHLFLILEKASILNNMHEAYARIQVDEEGFGVFVAGPSKTADIEQSLVIGAQGPRSLTVFLM